MSSQTKFIFSLITDFLDERNAVGLIYLEFSKGLGLLPLAKWFNEVRFLKIRKNKYSKSDPEATCSLFPQ